ncbi:MAG: SDR family NAD(P)-dependent oxidoreductase, partial [Pseudomonadota bacterium]
MTKQSANVNDIRFPDAFEPPDPNRCAVLVTGAARRLGRAFAVDLAAAGWPVVIHYNGSVEAAHEVKDTIEREGGLAAVLQADLTREDEVNSLMERAGRLLGPIGILINNASVFEWDDTSSATAETFALHMDVHLKSPLILCQQFANHLPDGAGGIIVNVIDSRVLNPTPRHLT